MVLEITQFYQHLFYLTLVAKLLFKKLFLSI